MMPGSAETLPAGFRLTATSGHSRRLPPEGKCSSTHSGNVYFSLAAFNNNTKVMKAAQDQVRSILTVSLVLSDGCSAVLYEALDDSPDDMYLDWFQGQLCPSEGSGLLALRVFFFYISSLPIHTVQLYLSFFSLWSLALASLLFLFYSVISLTFEDVVLHRCKIVVSSPWQLKKREGGGQVIN